MKKELKFSDKKIDCLRQIYKKIKNNDLLMARGIIELERLNQDKTIADLNRVFKFLYETKRHRKHLCCNQFVECPVFRIPPFLEDD